MASPLPWLVALGAAGLVLSKMRGASSGESSAPISADPVPLRAGVPYLFLVRLDVSDAAARPVLEEKGVENLEFSPASVVPFWLPEDATEFSTRIASFKAVPRGNSHVSLGMPFYGVGRLERLVRLDARPFSEPAGDV
jgi:hypothetical protein